MNKYRINDALTQLCSEMGVNLPDDTLDRLSHYVADVLENKPYDATNPSDPLTAAAVIARLNEDMYRALQQNEQLDDLLAETRDTLTIRINVLKDQLRLREEQCSRLETECEEYGSIVANKDAEIAELKANPPMFLVTEEEERLRKEVQRLNSVNEMLRYHLRSIYHEVLTRTKDVF